MIATDEDDLICDFAEHYHVYDYKALEVQQAAILACGLPDFCRIKRKMANQKIDLMTAMIALVLDDLNMLLWKDTKNGRKGRNRPKSIYQLLTSEQQVKEIESFSSAEAFERKRAMLLTKKEKNNGKRI